MLKQFTQLITLISLHVCLKDVSTEVYVMSINVSISIVDDIRSLQCTKIEQAQSLQGVLSSDIKQVSSQ